MSCLCGDTACPSCGPAQGYDPAFEALCDDVAEACPRIAEDEVALAEVATLLADRLQAERDDTARYVRGLRERRDGIAGPVPAVTERMTADALAALITNYLEGR